MLCDRRDFVFRVHHSVPMLRILPGSQLVLRPIFAASMNGTKLPMFESLTSHVTFSHVDLRSLICKMGVVIGPTLLGFEED